MTKSGEKNCYNISPLPASILKKSRILTLFLVGTRPGTLLIGRPWSQMEQDNGSQPLCLTDWILNLARVRERTGCCRLHATTVLLQTDEHVMSSTHVHYAFAHSGQILGFVSEARSLTAFVLPLKVESGYKRRLYKN